MPKLEVFPISLVGGLQDSKAIPEPGDMQVLNNVALFRGRFALRAPVTVTAQLLSHASDETPTAVDHVLATKHHKGKLYALAWRGGGINKTYLYRLESDGTPEGGGATSQPVTATAVWTGAFVPRPVMVSFDGGSATAPVSRLYFADWTTSYDTRFWDSDGNTLNNVTEDFNDDGAKENLRFGLIWTYQFHMWGTGYHASGSTNRPEFVRFSQPGLIPAEEPNVTNNIMREWWFVEGFGVGRRGDRPVTVGFAGGGTVIFKRHESYVLFGYDADSWAVRQLSGRMGAVGPYAACSTGSGLCLFWSDRGPMMTDGQEIVDISEDIRKHVNEAGTSDTISAEYSSDDGIAYFTVPSTGDGVPDKHFGFDVVRKKWLEGQWLNSGGTALMVNHLYAAPQDTLAGPLGPPSALTATAMSDTQIDLEWVNGDTALEVMTTIHRSATGGFTPDDGNKIATVASGLTMYSDTGLTSKTTYHYEVLHVRNSQASAGSGEDSAKTWLTEPTDLVASGLVDGIRVTYTNNEDGADIEIERKPSGGAWTTHITVPALSLGVKTHDDGTATCLATYSYRARAKMAGETTSEYSNESSAVACFAPPTITGVSHGIFINDECPMGDNVDVSWSATDVTAADTAAIYRDVNGGGFELRAIVPLQNYSYTEQWPRKNGVNFESLQYRVEAYDEGITLSSSGDSTLSNHNTSSECFEA